MSAEQKRALFIIFLLCVILFLVSACGDPPPTEGYVTRHEYDDPDDIWHPGYTIDGGQTCTGGYNGVPRTCTDNPDTHIPGHWEHDPAHYILHIRLEEFTKNDKGESKKVVRSGNCEVSYETYNAVHDGQYFDCKSGKVVPK